jgi:hypothetical protein
MLFRTAVDEMRENGGGCLLSWAAAVAQRAGASLSLKPSLGALTEAIPSSQDEISHAPL